MNALKDLGIKVSIWPIPVELFDEAIPFHKDDRHASYDRNHVLKWWQILVSVDTIFERFRSTFRGKQSPIHFFWGSFDLAGSRFSGRKATPPKMTGVMDKIMRYSENEENFAFGFWPGDARFPEPAFYAYTYPAPANIKDITVGGGGAFNEKLNEFILLYDKARNSKTPEKDIMDFLNSTYTGTATLAGWDIEELRNDML